MNTLREESTFDDWSFEDLQGNFILLDRLASLAEFGVCSLDNVDIVRLKWLIEELDRPSNEHPTYMGYKPKPGILGATLPGRCLRTSYPDTVVWPLW